MGVLLPTRESGLWKHRKESQGSVDPRARAPQGLLSAEADEE